MDLKTIPTQRNSQLELLRVLCMIMIVAYHYSVYGFYAEDLVYSPNKSIIELLAIGGETGVNVFVLISGYYMTTSSYSFRKFMLFLGQIWFYTLGALLLFLLAFPELGLVTKEMLSMSLLPISKGHYWFATSFFVLMLISPFLNIFVRNASCLQLLGAIWVLLVIYSILPTFFKIFLTYSTISRFIILYLTAAYIRLYLSERPMNSRKHALFAIGLFAFAAVRMVLMNHFGQASGNEIMLENSDNLTHGAGLYVYLMGLELFLAFVSAQPRYNKGINRVAGLTFGVYLFHENQLLRSLWQHVFKTAQFIDSPYLPVHALCSIALVYIAASLVELLRQKTLGRLWTWFTDHIAVVYYSRFCAHLKGVLEKRGIT